jgi:hypothetical protein
VRQALALPRLGYLELADGALLEAVGDAVPDGLVVVAAGDAALLRHPGGAAVLDAVLVGGETEDDVRSALVGAARAGEPR